ncbi:biotin/lipoyl-containing protein [Nocardiopsis chromatogenes]|uniref:biotin/lipoyl-containing protein n=1 Tax=Nocardiopsis chromatogenes TaxID=280239 RepID=UPI00034C853A|nr:biotin/lipoyl-containing protein [Nocardiopsis chromatogenes]
MTDTTERTFTLPDLGEGLVEATVLEWLAAPGDEIARNAPLVELETTKSAVEIPSPHGGTIVRLHAAEGEVVQVGAPLVTFAVEAPAGDGRTGAQSGIVGRVPTEDEPPRRRGRLRPPQE